MFSSKLQFLFVFSLVHVAAALQEGSTALIRAVTNGHTDCVRLLIDARADTEATNHVRLGRFDSFLFP